MNTPLWIIYFLILVDLLMAAHMHGKKGVKIYNFWQYLIINILTILLIQWTLEWKIY